MSIVFTDPVIHIVPRSDDLEFCHVLLDDESAHMCGRPYFGEPLCPDFDGEAICPGCGLPTCPRCAVLDDLEDRLV